ncbi:hypothetical protein GCM10010259_19460 [Streptomyces daghestanicus]|uniref:Uncharacterized protein n=1 Tax=Streptomyces griseoviridis TaxID=45398 RepID=A0A918LLC4_STRGD|nr:hypothetical protein GCM10010238_68020 [Streptomyces niveoruber]GGT14544.1 hypothetical protein GCM10010240_54920 [Streptomyces griseoviridis]GGU28954.1 hypothetical protein GCM10010259_19460 [Streptomyces daghestanicus]
MVMTRVVMPRTVPSVVRAERVGRASTPASASDHRSLTSIQGRSTVPVAGALPPARAVPVEAAARGTRFRDLIGAPR